MASRLPPVTASTPTLQTAASSVSRNTLAGGLLVLAGVAAAVYAIFDIYKNRSINDSPHPSPRRLPFGERHTSGLRMNGELCLNERAALPFDKCAEGVISFNSFLFDTPLDDLSISCYIKGETTPFCEQRVESNLATIEFFIPNLPYGKEIVILIGKQYKFETKVDQEHGIYTLSKEGDTFTFSSKAMPAYKILPPEALSFMLDDKLELDVSAERPTTIRSTYSIDALGLTNLGNKVVVYLQLSNRSSKIDPNETDVVLPFILRSHPVQTLSLSLLKQMWIKEYCRATRSNFFADTTLTLAGIQQIRFEQSSTSTF
jgi:hypothetical protein